MIKQAMSIICTHCENGSRPIRLVVYSKLRDSYQFMCGEDGHGIDDADPIHTQHVLEDDPTLRELLDYSESFEAERSRVGDPWEVVFDPDIDDD